MIEIWKDITGYKGYYQVSNHGRVKSKMLWRGRGEIILKDCLNRDGYKLVSLSKSGRKKTFQVHRLVCEVFIQNQEAKEFVNHIDNDPSNNRLDNLEWCTPKENVQHSIKTNDGVWVSSFKKKKKLRQLSMNGELIRIWDSSQDVADALKVLRTNISAAARKYRGKKTAYGFIWEYA